MSIELSIELTLGSFDLRVECTAGAGITALFGPSGAGKTLTLRSVAGLVRPRAGRIVVSERTLYDSRAGIDLPARERGVGYLFQQYALFPHLDVGRNIAYGLQRMPAYDRQLRVTELLSLVGLQGMENRRPGELSGGQQQRVALARALAPEPRLLLLDEPFAAVDMRTRRRLRAELQRVQAATSIPMLLVTHDLDEVRQLSDWLVVMEAGRVRHAGPTAELTGAAEALLADLDAEVPR